MNKRNNKPKQRNVVNKKTNYKHSFSAISLSNYEKPEVKEETGKEWVSFGNDGNNYFQMLIDRSLSSPTNNRCIKGISDMIYGRGLEATDSEYKLDAYSEMKQILKGKDVKRICSTFKLLGQSSAQVIYNKNKTKVLKVLHYPMETLRAEKATDGVIKAWYYHPNWNEYKSSDKPKRIPAFGYGSKNDLVEMYVFKPYQSGFYYYSTADYHGCLQYAELEEEVSNYHISNIQNGLQPSLFINFNNGVPNEEQRDDVERKINDKFSGTSNAGRVIIGFNDSIEERATIEAIHLPDAHAQYQFLSDEAREKIMLGHGIVSPILLGIKDNTGFGNNAEELRTASIIMDNIVIRPLQQHLIDGFKEILDFNGIDLNLYFTTLQPIEFTELDNISTKVRKEEETGEKLSSVELEDFSDEEGEDMLSQLEALGEKVSDEWELIHSEKLEDESIGLTELADANPDKISREDNNNFKVRYAYAPVRKRANSRGFCKKMEALTERDIVFRKEDINMMSFRGVNKKLGHKKRNYSLLKYKGGKNCKHYWEVRVYRKKGSKVSIEDAKKEGFISPENPKEMDIRPFDMEDRGAYKKK